MLQKKRGQVTSKSASEGEGATCRNGGKTQIAEIIKRRRIHSSMRMREINAEHLIIVIKIHGSNTENIFQAVLRLGTKL